MAISYSFEEESWRFTVARYINSSIFCNTSREGSRREEMRMRNRIEKRGGGKGKEGRKIRKKEGERKGRKEGKTRTKGREEGKRKEGRKIKKWEGRKGGRKEDRKEERKEGRKEGRTLRRRGGEHP